MESNVEKKRPNIEGQENDPKRVKKDHIPAPKARSEMSTEELYATLKRQVEYYLSDSNLSRDAFFHEKLSNSHSQGLGYALNIEFILSSPRMKSLSATCEEIVDSLKGSEELDIKIDDKITWILRKSKDLPQLKVKGKMNAQQNEKNRDPHIVGCMLKLNDVPESISDWQSIKDTLRKHLPEKVHIRCVTNIDSNRQCIVWLGSFKDDKEILSKPIELDFGEGKKSTASLLDINEAKPAISQLPPRIRITREKEIQQWRRQLCGMALTVGGIKFNSVDHLKRCVADFLNKTEPGSNLKPDSAAEKVVMALLEYHPNCYFKKGGAERKLTGIRVDKHPTLQNENAENASNNTKVSFYAVRSCEKTKEEDYEDFSITKCIAELSKDPPIDPEALEEALGRRYEASKAASEASLKHINERQAAKLAEENEKENNS